MAPCGKLQLALMMVITISTITVKIALAADPDPLQDVCVADLNSKLEINGYPCKKDYTADDFTTMALAYPGDTNNIYGTKVTPANVEQFPGVNTQGISVSRVDFAPGGLNPPHVHPRASEIQYILKGELYFGFITTSNKFISKTIKQGEAVTFPRGMVHFQKNVGKEPAIALVSFNSQKPGVEFIPNALFNSTPTVPDEILGQAFQIDTEEVKNIKKRLSSDTYNVNTLCMCG